MASAKPKKVVQAPGGLLLQPLTETQMLTFFTNCYRLPANLSDSKQFIEPPFVGDLPKAIVTKQQQLLGQGINYNTILMGTHMSIMTPLTLQKPSTTSTNAETGLPLGNYTGINKEGETAVELKGRLLSEGMQNTAAAAEVQKQTAITFPIEEGDMVMSIHTLPGFSATNTGNFPPALFLFNGLNAPTFNIGDKQVRRSPLEHMALINLREMARTGKYTPDEYEAKIREDGLNYFGVGGPDEQGDSIPNFWCGGDYEEGSVGRELIMGTYVVSWGMHEGVATGSADPKLPMVYVVVNTRMHMSLRPRPTGASVIRSEYTSRAVFELVKAEIKEKRQAEQIEVFCDYFISACQVIDDDLGPATPEAHQLAETYTKLMLNMVIAQERVLSGSGLIVRKRTHSMNAALSQLMEQDRGAIAEAEERGGDYKTLSALSAIRFPAIGGISPDVFLINAIHRYNVLFNPNQTIIANPTLMQIAQKQLGIQDEEQLTQAKQAFDIRVARVVPAFIGFMQRAFGITLQGGGKRRRRRYKKRRKTKKRKMKRKTGKRKTRNNRKSRRV
jgi:hypothetical protein